MSSLDIQHLKQLAAQATAINVADRVNAYSANASVHPRDAARQIIADLLPVLITKLEAAEKMRVALGSSWFSVLFASDGPQPSWMRDLENEIDAAIKAYDGLVPKGGQDQREEQSSAP